MYYALAIGDDAWETVSTNRTDDFLPDYVLPTSDDERKQVSINLVD